MPQNPNHIAVNDLLGRPPGWLLHSGITLVFLVVLGGLLLSAFIHYPDELTGAVIIEHDQTPVSIAPIITAPLDTLLLSNGDTTQSGQLLGVLQSSTDWQKVLALEILLNNLKLDQSLKQVLPFQDLGVLQSTYANWISTALTYQQYENNNGVEQQRETILKEITYTQELTQIAKDQLTLFDEQVVLETNDYNRQIQLAEEEVISVQELENKKKVWLAIQQQREELEAKLVQYRLKINQLKQQRENLVHEDRDEEFSLAQNYLRLTEELRGQIQAWKEQYLLRAPMAGHLIFTRDIIENQFINAGETLFTIQPLKASETKLWAKIKIPVQGLGKIAPGDRVIIRLDAYPEKEYGTISSQLHHIAILPQTNADGQALYQLEALLETPLTTNYGKTIPLEIMMSGMGTVITKDRSILSRIFEQILSIIKNN